MSASLLSGQNHTQLLEPTILMWIFSHFSDVQELLSYFLDLSQIVPCVTMFLNSSIGERLKGESYVAILVDSSLTIVFDIVFINCMIFQTFQMLTVQRHAQPMIQLIFSRFSRKLRRLLPGNYKPELHNDSYFISNFI